MALAAALCIHLDPLPCEDFSVADLKATTAVNGSPAGGAHGMKLGSPEATFPTQYGDKYNIHAGVSEKGPSHPPESSWGTFEKNRFQYR
ncbi:hypothetical protein TRIUR3_13362 [Triticum urartu]|uniref:Uncharacterized protein n=1 Tax=Triticum urartu TaxID=4572 RepID=M7ZT97_TRIUA|nr:hypothetical protein TRIUR3_13362 [Triticum urartu]